MGAAEKTIQEANKETSDDELNINTRKLIQEYEHEAKLERVLTISEMPINDGPDLRMEEPDSEQQMKKEDCAELSVSPHVTLTTSVGRPKSENSGNIQEDDYRRVCIYTQQELDARIRQIEQSFKHKDKKEQRHQLYKWIITLAIAIILAALAGIILYEQFSRMAPTDVEQTAVNPSAIEGAYSMTHIVNGTRDPQPMQAAIKHNGGEDYTIALISEYDPEMYDLSIRNDGTAFSSVLGEGKLVPSLSGMIIIELVKGNETWKFMK